MIQSVLRSSAVHHTHTEHRGKILRLPGVSTLHFGVDINRLMHENAAIQTADHKTREKRHGGDEVEWGVVGVGNRAWPS